MVPKVLILMADYGHDPTETAVPYTAFKNAGFDVQFATETGNSPKCDERMISGMTQKLLGAAKKTVGLYHAMKQDPAAQSPLAWNSPSFSLDSYNLLFFPGGHEKGVRQVIDSPVLRKLLARYFPETRKPSKKAVAAVCHGVLAVAEATLPDGKRHGVLGDYYKTYGAGSDGVETCVRKRLDNPSKQYFNSLGPGPFVHEDAKYNYVSARFPGDVEVLAKKTVALIQQSVQS